MVDSTKLKKKPEKEKVEYDGYYLVLAETTGGFRSKVGARGYNLKSWVEFHKSLSTTKEVSYIKVTEEEYMMYHWTSSKYTEPKKPPKEIAPDPVKKTKRNSSKANTIMDFLAQANLPASLPNAEPNFLAPVVTAPFTLFFTLATPVSILFARFVDFCTLD